MLASNTRVFIVYVITINDVNWWGVFCSFVAVVSSRTYMYVYCCYYFVCKYTLAGTQKRTSRSLFLQTSMAKWFRIASFRISYVMYVFATQFSHSQHRNQTTGGKRIKWNCGGAGLGCLCLCQLANEYWNFGFIDFNLKYVLYLSTC